MHTPLWIWIAFTLAVIALLGIDLALDRGRGEQTLRRAAVWSAVWIGLGAGFAGVLWVWRGGGIAGEYAAGYLVEKSLSVDNVFVFAVIFSALAVPPEHRKRILFWGILGALACRGAFIAAGASLLEAAHATVYVFAAILLLTAVKLLRHREIEVRPERNLLLRGLRRVLPVADDDTSGRFLVRRNGVLMATPLLAALIAIETTDIVFAVDSIPAIFAITDDPFIVYSSNAFAILGLRSLYFLLDGSLARFRHLGVGLAGILAFAGVKMALSDVWHPPVWLPLLVIAAILGGALWASTAAGERALAGLRRLGRTRALLLAATAALAGAWAAGVFDGASVESAVRDAGTSLGGWTYALVGGLAFIETAVLAGLVAPGEIAVVMGGVAAAQGGVDVLAIGLVAWGAASAGDATGYALGRRLGRPFLERHGPRAGVSPALLARVEGLFARHGAKLVLAGRFVGVVRAVAPSVAGASRMPARRFLSVAVPAAGLWAAAFTALGWAAAANLDRALDVAAKGKLALGAVLVLGAGAVVLRRRRARARVAAPAEEGAR